MIRCTLLVPAPLDAVSGGYGYDRAILEGLRALGHDAQAVELAGRYPLADAAACEAAAEAFDAVPADRLAVIDGLALPGFQERAAALQRRRCVGLIHHPTSLETGFGEAERARLRALERDLLPRLARIIVTSAATGACLTAEYGVDADRIAVVMPGTDAAPRSRGVGSPPCAILSVGALVSRKGHDVLLRALARLFDLDWRLTIVGSAQRDPAHAQALRELAGHLGIADRVRFAGEVDAATLETLWQSADVFALATWWEGYGMAIAEALKRGLPVAVTGGGGAGGLVSPRSGVVCTPGDETTLSKSLRRIIFDQDLRKAMAEAAWTEGQSLPSWPTQCGLFAEALR